MCLCRLLADTSFSFGVNSKKDKDKNELSFDASGDLGFAFGVDSKKKKETAAATTETDKKAEAKDASGKSSSDLFNGSTMGLGSFQFTVKDAVKGKDSKTATATDGKAEAPQTPNKSTSSPVIGTASPSKAAAGPRTPHTAPMPRRSHAHILGSLTDPTKIALAHTPVCRILFSIHFFDWDGILASSFLFFFYL